MARRSRALGPTGSPKTFKDLDFGSGFQLISALMDNRAPDPGKAYWVRGRGPRGTVDSRRVQVTVPLGPPTSQP